MKISGVTFIIYSLVLLFVAAGCLQSSTPPDPTLTSIPITSSTMAPKPTLVPVTTPILSPTGTTAPIVTPTPTFAFEQPSKATTIPAQTFTLKSELPQTPTPPFKPTKITTGIAVSIKSDIEVLYGTTNELGSASRVNICFEWGETEAYGQTTELQTLTATGEFSCKLTGLKKDQFYHFRAVTSDGIQGKDSVFKTLSAGGMQGPLGGGA
jgi:hypothetical protein